MKDGSRDFNALAFDPDKPRDPHARHFIPRQGARNKALEINFNPDAHREWVTGFRKRKNERKTAAIKGLEEKAKRERLEERQERFRLKKERLHLPDDYGVEDSDDEKHTDLVQKVTDRTVYESGAVTTTVTTAALAYSDDEAGDEDSDEDGASPTAAAPAPAAAAPSSMFPSTYEEEEEDEEEEEEEELPRGGRTSASHHAPAPTENMKVKGANPKSRKGGEGPSQGIRTANKLAALKARKGGGVKKLPGQGKSKKKQKAKAVAKIARGKKGGR